MKKHQIVILILVPLLTGVLLAQEKDDFDGSNLWFSQMNTADSHQKSGPQLICLQESSATFTLIEEELTNGIKQLVSKPIKVSSGAKKGALFIGTSNNKAICKYFKNAEFDKLGDNGFIIRIDTLPNLKEHPLNIKEVAHGLFLEAQRIVYNDSYLVSSGPLYTSIKIEDGSIIHTFKWVGAGLYANSMLKGFQITDKNRRSVWANVVVLSKNTVKVWDCSVTSYVNAYYA